MFPRERLSALQESVPAATTLAPLVAVVVDVVPLLLPPFFSDSDSSDGVASSCSETVLGSTGKDASDCREEG